MKYPFEASRAEIEANPDGFVASVFSSLESEFLVIPKGEGFIEYPAFERAYEVLKRTTEGFHTMDRDAVLTAALRTPLVLVVLRTILGFTPSEWAYVTTTRTGVSIPQGFARSLDRRIRMSPETPLEFTPPMLARVRALTETACQLVMDGAPGTDADHIHRLDKADTEEGLVGVQSMARLGAPYAMLLYERFLGRPFAGHRDSVSELVGYNLESAIERVLDAAGISHQKTRRAERIPGLDQAPDFVIPDKYTLQVVIEAKITEDDGTARDKVTRVQHLDSLSRRAQLEGRQTFEVVACIGGRGFAVRKEDMRKLLLATGGKVFTLQTLDRMVGHTRLREFRTQTRRRRDGGYAEIPIMCWPAHPSPPSQRRGLHSCVGTVAPHPSVRATSAIHFLTGTNLLRKLDQATSPRRCNCPTTMPGCTWSDCAIASILRAE